MNIDSYQVMAVSTAIYPSEHGLAYTALGLAGEAGECAEKVKKVLRDNNGLIDQDRRAALKKELGDVLWYLANLAQELGYNLSDIAEENVRKLKSRQQRGVLTGDGDNR